MRNGLIVLWVLLCSIASAGAQVHVSIGINLPVYPQLVRVPGYPVYYAPQVNSNYFFYDGMYWVYWRDNWYASPWYNGPWELVSPEAVPLFVLRVPVRYYRRPPAYFRAWRSNAPPRWGMHWGNAWEQHRRGWDNWDRRSVPSPAPLPVYQRQYSGNRYPRVEQQQALQSQNYRYQPRDAVVQQHYQAQRVQSAPASPPPVTQGMAQQRNPPQQEQRQRTPPSPPQERQAMPQQGSAPQQDRAQRVQNAPPSPPRERQAMPEQRSSPQQDQGGSSRTSSLQQGAPPTPRGQPPQQGGGDAQRPAAAHAPPQQGGSTAQRERQQQQQGAARREQQEPRSQGQGLRGQGPQGPGPQGQGPQGQGPQGQGPQGQGPQGKGPPQEPKQNQEKGREKGEQRENR